MELYTWNTPNGQKPMLMLEEIGAEYTIVPIDITAGAQDEAAFRQINPNGKIPAMRDSDLVIFESGAILLHLAERSGRFLPEDPSARMTALSWSFWQVGGLGPMAGQWGHFTRREERNPYAEKRYLDETLRLFGVLEQALDGKDWLAGGSYSIADMMAWPWVSGIFDIFAANGDKWAEDYPVVNRWCEAIATREATIRALEKLKRAVED
ncbi:thiol:disulfide oxidoreductase [Altericroceibacterium spongiae]|uniref:Thiol:disulfide oxidoreductase n=1 Tax=Altericroceibacterium spongiae TaxID=2320269 RepID=A0A420EKE4_9SPHN|nr:glutathione S-transferase C-terminal domain-containing protein [Altericroceibacterium spongiae]RKF21165.1 thiol:disulfide oxidoreductase [Altericroceibacterium spongiae]